MPKKKLFHEELAEKLEAQAEGAAAPSPAADDDARKAAADLDDAKHQAAIMSPSGTDVEFSFGTLRLYPFTMFDQATAKGFCDGVYADVFGLGARNSVEAGYRMSSVILKSAAHKRELLGLLAIASKAPGTIDSADKADPIAAGFAQQLRADDYIKAFKEIQDRSQVKPRPKA